jgi:hypothetical protein
MPVEFVGHELKLQKFRATGKIPIHVDPMDGPEKDLLFYHMKICSEDKKIRRRFLKIT